MNSYFSLELANLNLFLAKLFFECWIFIFRLFKSTIQNRQYKQKFLTAKPWLTQNPSVDRHRLLNRHRLELKYFLNSVLLQATIAATNRKIAAKDNKTAKLRRESEVRDLDLQVIKETIIRTLSPCPNRSGRWGRSCTETWHFASAGWPFCVALSQSVDWHKHFNCYALYNLLFFKTCQSLSGNLALTESWIVTLPSEFLWYWLGVRTSPHVLVLLMSLIIALVTSVIATCKYWHVLQLNICQCVLCIGMYCGVYCGVYWWYALNTYQHVFNTLANRYVFNRYMSVLARILLVLRLYCIIICANIDSIHTTIHTIKHAKYTLHSTHIGMYCNKCQ